MIHIKQTNFGHGTNRYVEKEGKVIATIHKHSERKGAWDKWSVNWVGGRVDWHNTLAEARDNALKGL